MVDPPVLARAATEPARVIDGSGPLREARREPGEARGVRGLPDHEQRRASVCGRQRPANVINEVHVGCLECVSLHTRADRSRCGNPSARRAPLPRWSPALSPQRFPTSRSASPPREGGVSATAAVAEPSEIDRDVDRGGFLRLEPTVALTAVRALVAMLEIARWTGDRPQRPPMCCACATWDTAAARRCTRCGRETPVPHTMVHSPRRSRGRPDAAPVRLTDSRGRDRRHCRWSSRSGTWRAGQYARWDFVNSSAVPALPHIGVVARNRFDGVPSPQALLCDEVSQASAHECRTDDEHPEISWSVG